MKPVVIAVLILNCLTFVEAGEPRTSGLDRTAWAEALSGGPLRVVFIAPFSAHHDSFELMQRMDIDGTVVPVAAASNVKQFGIPAHYWPDLGKSPERVLEDVQRALETDWEVIAMSAFPKWSAYPEQVRTSVLAAVSSGRALMIGSLGNGLEDDLQAAGLKLEETSIGAARFPFADPQDGVATIYRCGKGHLVHFYARNDSRFGYLLSNSPLQSEFEYSTARACWFLRQAARPKTQVCISAMSIEDGRMNIRTEPGSSTRRSRVKIVVRRHDNYDPVFRTEGHVKPGKPIVANLPHLPGGQYLAEVVFVGDGHVVDWDVHLFAVERPVKLVGIQTNKKTVSAGGALVCKLDTEGPTDDLKMAIRWFDQWNRLLITRERRRFTDEIVLEAPEGSLSVLNRVEITLLSDRGPEATATAEVLMPENVRPTDFYVLYWNTGLGGSWRRLLYYDALRRHGLADAFECSPRAPAHSTVHHCFPRYHPRRPPSERTVARRN